MISAKKKGKKLKPITERRKSIKLFRWLFITLEKISNNEIIFCLTIFAL